MKLNEIKGFGDLVAFFAQPIARWSDKLFGTSLSGCEECKQRHETWNKKYPLKFVVLFKKAVAWVKSKIKK